MQVPSVKASVLGIKQDYPALSDKDSFIAWAGNRAFIGSKTARVARVRGPSPGGDLWLPSAAV
jgi:hypothetical protein